MSASPRLYALLVGINNYNIKPLKGCVNDVENVETYLKHKTTSNCAIEKVLNEDATKKNITAYFRAHLGKAQKGDTVLFYFSGHGTQEVADSIWDEPDCRLECIVCYDAPGTAAPDFIMADKELRYLIHELSQREIHIVTIFDCCHSGDNTRNGPLVSVAFGSGNVQERRLSKSFPKREWQDFIFSAAIAQSLSSGQVPEQFLPQGAHVQLAACESDESALEIDGQGVFTQTLLKVLEETGGNINYNALQGRIRQYMRFVYEQQPRIYSFGEDDSLLHTNFLNVNTSDRHTLGEVVYNNIKKSWILNLGAIHGVVAGAEVELIDPQDAGKIYPATTSEVYVDYAILLPASEQLVKLDKRTVVRANVKGVLMRRLKLHLNNRDGHPWELQQIADHLSKHAAGHFVLEETEEAADYTLHIRHGRAYFTLPKDPFRPLTRPVETDRNTSVPQIAGVLKHISRWRFTKELQNQAAGNHPENPLKIEIWQQKADGAEEAVPVTGGAARLTFGEAAPQWSGTTKIRITNDTSQKLYVCAAYLDKAFGVYLKLLPEQPQPLEAGAAVFLGPAGKDVLTQKLDEVVHEYNWPAYTESINFIVSTQPFDPAALTLEQLPLPLTLKDRIEQKGKAYRSFVTDESSGSIAFSGWVTQSLSLTFVNPFHNRVEAADLNQMLDWEEMAYFALGLYYEAETDEYLRPVSFRLRREISIKEPLGERSGWRDAKVDLANYVESVQRRRRYESVKNSGRIRIVAEGDSWFQYPIQVRDILDHLSGLYAIRSLAAAGDTLRNYMQDPAFIEVIEREEPEFLLISGGGNDFLGKQFATYLTDNNDVNPSLPFRWRYLKNVLFRQLDNLQTIYRTLFTQLTSRYPRLHIIVHGYDYLIPLDTTRTENKGRPSWLGQYMIGKSIASQADREQIIRIIIDEFNERLEAVAREFRGRVSYLDLRRTVHPENWHDEIHPNDKGFQDIAMRFINRINQVKNAQARNERVPDYDLHKSGFILENNNPADAFISDIYDEPRREPPGFTTYYERIVEDTREPDPDLRPGQIDYEIPDVMRQGENCFCTVCIAGSEIPLEAIKISETSTHKTIPVAKVMSVHLLDAAGGEDFKIVPYSSQVQEIRRDQITRWQFGVKPLKAGVSVVLLRVTAHFEGTTHDIDLMQKAIRVDGQPAGQDQDQASKGTAGPGIRANWSDILLRTGGLSRVPRASIKKIVFIAADTRSSLLLGRESNIIRNILQMSDHRDDFLYTTYLGTTAFDFTGLLLKEKPVILHYSGHGTAEGIYLVDEQEGPVLARTEMVKRLFAVLKGKIPLECVVLNACYSHLQGAEISRSIPFVIGTLARIGDEEATNFSRGFYQGLGAGMKYGDAFEWGRVQVGLSEEGNEKVLVLLRATAP